MDTGEKQRKIYILLTKQYDPASRVWSVLSASRYLHASIGFEERGTFFSFNTKRGFCIEQPSKKRQFVPCLLYSLDVTEEVYNDIEERIRVFRENPKPYRFASVGMFLAFFRIPLKLPFLYHNSYFCTMFVSELIIKSGAAKLKFRPFRYLPRHFSHEPDLKLCFEGVWGQPPVFSEDQGDLTTIPVRYAKRYVRMAERRARITVKFVRRNTVRRVRIARGRAIRVRDHVFRAPGKLAIICRDNLVIATKATRDAFERWWL